MNKIILLILVIFLLVKFVFLNKEHFQEASGTDTDNLYVALRDYTPPQDKPQELNFSKGELIRMIDTSKEYWWWAESESAGREGWVPFDYFVRFDGYNLTADCNKKLDDEIRNINEFTCGRLECCVHNPYGDYCNTTGLSDNAPLIQQLIEQKDNNTLGYNIVVDPDTPLCVDFCVKTYTNTDPNEDNFGGFRDDNRLSTFVSSKCSECINNHYERLKLLKDPYSVSDCTEPVNNEE